MKDHFQKLLTEAERAGSRNPSVKWGRNVKYDPDSDYEDEIGGFIAWSRHRHVSHKELTDVLSPLRGYLRKNVGRPWNDVYSEICHAVDRRTTTGAHIFMHLWQYVERHSSMGENGKVYSRLWRHEVNEWYVHPLTGVLCYKERKRCQWEAPQTPGEIKIGEGKSYQRINGIWYYTEWVLTNPWKTKPEKTRKIILHKKQLSRRELRALGVQNSLR